MIESIAEGFDAMDESQKKEHACLWLLVVRLPSGLLLFLFFFGHRYQSHRIYCTSNTTPASSTRDNGTRESFYQLLRCLIVSFWISYRQIDRC